MTSMDILCENSSADLGYLAEWGLSIFLNKGERFILFDTGHTDIYLRNAQKMQISLENTDYIVISHCHEDHIGGVFHFPYKGKKILMHPHVLEKITSRQRKILEKDFVVQCSAGPLELVPGIFYLGEIPRVHSFEKGSYKGDPMLDDSALAIKMKEGVFVISGCAHAGICNICSYAQEIIGKKLYGVMGGFHLSSHERDPVKETIDYFHKTKPAYLFPMHCIDFSVLCELASSLDMIKLSAGNRMVFKGS
ncbi:MAG: MBL fold metallo-hydrolase [Parachlamydiales bacterium]|nr:MBL fold metallo-hydrolase [Parachlamydiales bacterium]